MAQEKQIYFLYFSSDIKDRVLNKHLSPAFLYSFKNAWPNKLIKYILQLTQCVVCKLCRTVPISENFSCTV